MNRTRIIAAVLVAAGLLSISGCGGYTTETMYDPTIRFIFVKMVERGKDVYFRDQEFKLTEAIDKQIEKDTGYKCTSKDRADAELIVTLDKIEQVGLSIDPNTGSQTEAGLEFTIICKLVYLKDKDRPAKGPVTITAARSFTGERFVGYEKVTNGIAERVTEFLEKW